MKNQIRKIHSAGCLFAVFFFVVGALFYSPMNECDQVTTLRCAAPVYSYKVINEYPHDRGAFTEGLVFENGFLYEGTGLYGQSTLRKVELETGNVLKMYELSDQYFGEGITIYKDEIIQLTYRSHVGFVYDKEWFTLLDQFTYSTEGWGLTYDGEFLIMSDGSSALHFIDPETFVEVNQIDVHDEGEPVTNLNELEYIKGEIYANIWQTDYIAVISPQTGEVTGWINLEGLLEPEDHTKYIDVLNGIAYDEDNDRLFVTGKLWPHLYEIELVPLLCFEKITKRGPGFEALSVSLRIFCFYVLSMYTDIRVYRYSGN